MIQRLRPARRALAVLLVATVSILGACSSGTDAPDPDFDGDSRGFDQDSDDAPVGDVDSIDVDGRDAGDEAEPGDQGVNEPNDRGGATIPVDPGDG